MPILINGNPRIGRGVIAIAGIKIPYTIVDSSITLHFAKMTGSQRILFTYRITGQSEPKGHYSYSVSVMINNMKPEDLVFSGTETGELFDLRLGDTRILATRH